MYGDKPQSIMLCKSSPAKFPSRIFFNSVQILSPDILASPAAFSRIAFKVSSSCLLGNSAILP